MNIYDPADGILYVHMAETAHPRSFPVGGGTTCITLPAGYANQSPRTRLQRRSARFGNDLAEAASLRGRR
jgi:hypothetical protein